MRLTIPKNRIVPLILFAVGGTLIALIFGMYFMNSKIQENYNTTVATYDLEAEKSAIMTRQKLEDTCQSLQVFAKLIGETEELSSEQIKKALSLLEQAADHRDIAIVDTTGKGYNISGDNVDYTDENYFLEATSGKTTITGISQEDSQEFPGMIFTVPIMKDANCLGVLLAIQDMRFTAPTNLGDNDNMDKIYSEDEAIYILNDKKEVISYFNVNQVEQFDYGQVIASGLLHDKFKVLDFKKEIKKNLAAGKVNDEILVWYQKPLGINDWSLLVGRTSILDPITKNFIVIGNVSWIALLVSITLIFLTLTFYQRRSNQKLIQMLYLDPVTGGSNWYKFRHDTKKILNSRMFLKKHYALVNFDINRFKVINDSFGHQKGDEVLRDIYNLVNKWAKPGEPVTRYSADQFYILMSYQEESDITERITELNNRLHQLKFTKTVKFYFGVYYIKDRKNSIDRMGEFAGIAKLKIKGSNDEIVSCFDNTSKQILLEEEKIEKSMYAALKNNEFLVYLQPKYTTVKEELSGAEALVRWNKGKNELISPGQFIPLFEKNGFIVELDMYMLRNVCRIQRSWMDKGFQPMPISVNISRVHFANPHLSEIIRDTVDEYGIPHEMIELELSENAFLQNKQRLITTVIHLRKYGFLVSMDDFGAGYSSLNSLKDIPLDVVKLDGELFRITEEAERGLTVIRSAILMAKDLNMKVVAECIETKEQVDFLCTIGCDIIQGYYYAKPMPVEQFEVRYLSPVI